MSENKLDNCCIWLVIYLNCTMMHGLTNLKLYVTNIFCKNTWWCFVSAQPVLLSKR